MGGRRIEWRNASKQLVEHDTERVEVGEPVSTTMPSHCSGPSAHPPTWPRNSGSAATSTAAPTSIRSASCSTSCFTGTPPFTATTSHGLMRQHLEMPVPSLATHRADLPAGVDDILQIALAKEPTRYRHMGELKAALDAAVWQRQSDRGASRTGVVHAAGTDDHQPASGTDAARPVPRLRHQPLLHHARQVAPRPCCWVWSWSWSCSWPDLLGTSLPAADSHLAALPSQRQPVWQW